MIQDTSLKRTDPQEATEIDSDIYIILSIDRQTDRQINEQIEEKEEKSNKKMLYGEKKII